MNKPTRDPEQCILDVDSPSYLPEEDEYRQCGCRRCLAHLVQLCNCDTKCVEYCPQHGIAASNSRQNDYWRRVGGHD